MATSPREKPKAEKADPNAPPREAARGVVAAVTAMDREPGREGVHAEIVDRVFGPAQTPRASGEPVVGGSSAPLYSEIDVEFSLAGVARKQASVLGPASKVAGDLVADENIEIEGLVEGCVRARRSRVTVGRDGFVQSRIEARSVRVKGTVRGNVSAEDWIEVKPGGVIRGDVCAPRIVLHDGAVVTGRIDMSQAATRRHAPRFDPLVIPPRPGMRKVARGKSAPR